MKIHVQVFLFFFSFNISLAQDVNFKDSARHYFTKGDFNKAINWGELELSRTRQLIPSNDTATLLACSDLALFYANIRKQSLAEPLYKEALMLSKKIYGIQHYQTATILGNYARLKQESNNYPEALHLTRQAIDALGNQTQKENERRLIFYNNLGLIFIDMGDFIKAEQQFNSVISEWESLGFKKGIDYATFLNNLAVTYKNLNNYSSAAINFQKAYEILAKELGTAHPTTAIVLGNLGFMKLSNDDFVGADTLLKKSMKLKEKIFGSHSEQYALSLHQLGINYRIAGNFEAADSFLNAALKIRNQVLGSEHPNYSITLSELGRLYFENNMDTNAEMYFNEALMHTKKKFGTESPNYLNLLIDMMLLKVCTKAYMEALNSYLSNKKNINAQILRSLNSLSANELQSFLGSYKKYFSLPFNLLSAGADKAKLLEEVFNQELLVKGVSLENTKGFIKAIAESRDSVLLKKSEAYFSNLSLLSKNFALPLQKRTIDADSLLSEINAQEKFLIQVSVKFRQRQEERLVNWQTVKRKLSNQELAIEFVRFTKAKRKFNSIDTAYYAALITKKNYDNPKFIMLCSELELQSALGKFAYKGKLSQAKSPVKSDKIDNIFNLICKPIEKHLTNVKKIYFAPDGLLHQIAFAAIATPDKKLLMDKYQLVQLSSTREIVNEQEKRQIPGTALFFGGINYNSQKFDTASKPNLDAYAFVYQQNHRSVVDSFEYLTNSLPEVEAAAKKLSLVKAKTYIYKKSNASESNFRTAAERLQPRLIHFATHGFALPDTTVKRGVNTAYTNSQNPLMRTGLAMAGGNNGWKARNKWNEDNGILTGMEIANLQLPKTQLVVLSACETANGEIQGSEGIFGLQRAFKLAGAEYIMATLWQIPDKQTKEFMELFYSKWVSGSSIQDAFYFAQQAMRKKWLPYYWAGFTLIK